MGAAAAPIIGGLISVAGAGLSAFAMSKMMKNNTEDMGKLSQLAQQNNQDALSSLPKAPEAPTGNAADAATNEAEAERQKQLAAMAANEAATNPTGGLGLSTPANTKKKTLGGM